MKKKSKNIFIYVVICIAVVLLLEQLFNIFDLAFRSWFIMLFISLSFLGIFVSLIQLICKIKKKVRRNILLFMSFIIIFPALGFSVYMSFMTIDEEFVVTKYDKKMVAKLHSFFSVDVEYYEYKNFLLRGKNVRIHEYYGEGGFNPIKNKYGHEYLVHSGSYYDKNGNKEGNFKIPVDEIEDNVYPKNAIEYTKDMLNENEYTCGVIYKIDDSRIYFYEEGLGRGKLYFVIKNKYEFYNGRINEKMNKEDVRIGDYLFAVDGKMCIVRNLIGDYLKNELITNFTIEKQLLSTNNVEFEEITILGDESAEVKILFGDIIGDTITDEKFTMVIRFDKNTKYTSKGNTVTSVKTLENVKYDINSIVLDKDTINKDSVPIVKHLDSYGS